MRRLLFLGGLLGAFLLTPTAFGADGDGCKDHSGTTITGFDKGPWAWLGCVQLCDGKVAADSDDCTEHDFADNPGMPDIVILEYEEDAETTVDPASACSAGPDITITTGPVTGGSLSADVPEYSPSGSSVVLNATTNRIIIDTSTASLDRFLFASIADMTACSNGGVDVRMFMYGRKNRL